MPALLIRTSQRPNAAWTVSARRSQSLQRAAWDATGSARTPCCSDTWSATARQASTLPLAAPTGRPAAPSPSTSACPMPRLPPVTTTTRSVSSVTSAPLPARELARRDGGPGHQGRHHVVLLRHAAGRRPGVGPLQDHGELEQREGLVV